MRKATSLLSVVTLLIVSGAPVLAIAAEEETFVETVIKYRTMDDPDVEPDLEVVVRAPFWNPDWDPADPPPGVLTFGSSLYSSQVRASDGVMVNSAVKKIGTATAVAIITDPTFAPFEAEVPMYFELDAGSLRIAGNGECETTQNALSEGGPVFLGCYMEVIPEYSTPGIRWGQASSITNFAPIPIPGFHTSSYWSVHIVWQ
jgi:hypothetical protein